MTVVTIAGDPASGGKVICAAHPADPFGERAAKLLHESAGAVVVCAALSPELTFEAMVDELEGVRRAAGIARWTFWGISGGGWLGQLYARRYPAALDGIILESVCASFRERLADPECLLSPFHPSWRGSLEARGRIAAGSHDEVGEADTEWIEVDSVGSVFCRRGGAALLVSPFPVTDGMRAAMPEMWRFDSRAWLSEIDTPALVITGDADPIVPLRHARAVHEGIRASQFAVLAGAGHSPVMQRRDDHQQIVRAFVRERQA